MNASRVLVCVVVAISLAASGVSAAEFDAQTSADRVVVRYDGTAIATYVFRDQTITRPYFAHVRTTEGIQVTRNHPPRPGDAQDHANFHPGLFLAFGDLSGSDNWRLKARVEHVRFASPPTGGPTAAFEVVNRYLANDGKEICREDCSFRFIKNKLGVLLVWESRFHNSDAGFYFGDQEEMGLGIRVATELSVRGKGRILDAAGRKNEKQIWGKQSEWCDYGGQRMGREVGLTVMSDPRNFRPSWHHARDYGFLAVNPFGRKAFTGGAPSRVNVARGETFRLNYGVLIRSGAGSSSAISAAYKAFVSSLAAEAK